ncbi:glycosyltransferase [Pseudomonas sp. NPDC089422]|uniref:glycosyltransferase n=1 Tax=Pseudomonas sp. NPDC089422 TaxID=3364466 RepID=UPI00382B3068
MNKRAEFAYFSQNNLWDRDAVSEQLAVAEDLIELIPEDVVSILDAGCGNGTVTNKLAKDWSVVGCDLSESAVRHVQAPALVADLSCIPFMDRHFDMVLSSDVIEHLPDEIYAKALSEIARVSAKYILIAVPYRETLEAAEVHCPKCGTNYHAHLHQRSYELEDAIGLFGEEFTPVAVSFSGEKWTFEDSKLVEAARNTSGLDYPFEDGVCPDCSTRRGHVPQAENAKRIKRRFESLQAMQVAEGLREVPPSSEILVLFERDAAQATEWLLPQHVGMYEESHINFAALVVRDNPVNYPRSVYRIHDTAGFGVVVMPRRPKTLEVVQGAAESFEVYDHVRGHYVACRQADQQNGRLLIASVPYGPHGCIIRIANPSQDLDLLADFEPADFVKIADNCMGDDPSLQQVRDQLIDAQELSERLEATRSGLELKLQAKELEINNHQRTIEDLNALANGLEKTRAEIESSYTLLSSKAAEQERAHNASNLKVDQLTESNQLLEENCTALRYDLEHLQLDHAEKNEQLQCLQEKLEQFSTLANTLESKRNELEQQCCRDYEQITEFTQRLNEVNGLANDLELQRSDLERELASKDDQLAVLEARYMELLTTADELEGQRVELESQCERNHEQLTELLNSLASTNELANSLELQRERLERELFDRDARLAVLECGHTELLNSTNLLEYKRCELEEKCRRSSVELAEQLQYMESLNNLSNQLEAQRAELELALGVKDSHLSAMEKSQAEIMAAANALASRLDESSARLLDQQALLARIDSLELDKSALSLEVESLQVDIKVRANEIIEKNKLTEQLGDLTSRLELQRQMLEDKVQSFGSMIDALSKEKTEYQVLAKALAMQTFPVEHYSGAVPKAVLVVSHMYPREYNKVGGIFVHEQVKALRALGVDARVVSGEPFWINTYSPRIIKRALDIYRKQALPEWEENEGVPVIRFPYIVSALLPFQTHAFTYSHGLMRHAARLREKFDFQLIHAHTAYTDGTAARKLAGKYKMPLVITEHTGPFTTLTRTAYLRRTTQKSLNAADKVISVSNALLGDIRKNVHLSPKLKTQVIPNLVDTEFFRVKPLPSDGQIHMLWVGHFVPVKRIPLLLEAFAVALKSEPRLRLSLAGDGEGENQARQLAAQLGIEDLVTFLGRATREELQTHYQNCHFLVISSETETFGVVAIEAMSCGRPVLSSDCGGPVDVITHSNLGRVVGLTVEDMADGMLHMAASLGGFDAQVIRKYSEMRFSASSVAKNLATVYMQALSDK